MTKKDWIIIQDALTRLSADVWDEASWGPRPDIEGVLDKVEERLEGRKK